jgi:purine-nucleoside phosphorylase
MDDYKNKVEQAADFLREKIGGPPLIGLLAGTGMGGAVEAMQDADFIAYGQIPHFPVSTVAGHKGRLVFGSFAGHRAVALQGRFHLYEGYSVLEATFGIRVLARLGIKVLAMANATGGLNPSHNAGDIMLITDHINLSGENPLVGKNVDEWGPRFPEMHTPYDPALAAAARAAALTLEIALTEGVYAGLKGPSLETPAEMRFLRMIGADVVGFSTVNEVICAVHEGIRVLGLAVVTNVNVPGRLSPASLDEIIAVADAAAPKVSQILEKALEGSLS